MSHIPLSIPVWISFLSATLWLNSIADLFMQEVNMQKQGNNHHILLGGKDVQAVKHSALIPCLTGGKKDPLKT